MIDELINFVVQQFKFFHSSRFNSTFFSRQRSHKQFLINIRNSLKIHNKSVYEHEKKMSRLKLAN